jgi:hypothetical protein
MGMDVYGLTAETEKGNYFRNNVWWWRPLAVFIEETYPDVAIKCEDWHSNSGYGLNKTDSMVLGKMILNDIADGTVKRYEDARLIGLSELPRDTCSLCDATGIRTDEVGVEQGMPNKELPTEIAIFVGRTHGTCNACNGVGSRENWALSYGFSVDNVQAFAEFLMECGGFEIC